ncbi:hypothetical protein GCM10007874_25680 [Labrys miyagiensis]|uniref:Transposase n=1 Tax=Labrys miyagiensis TaxID=346912 RepID=A0ABQ6CMR1_9HYPH|nr:hypothetical protein [Labrys miyagiensis]GLS19551.1 hypothetical protein GCM10007874_25680 [Labrys miyagiensis]
MDETLPGPSQKRIIPAAGSNWLHYLLHEAEISRRNRPVRIKARKSHLDSQIVTWARGYLDGYTGAMTQTDYTASIGGSEPSTVLNDNTVLRNQLRAYCLRHRSQPLESALRQILDRIGLPVGEAPTH